MRKIKTAKGIAMELCKREAGKKQVDIAQMTEIVGHLSDMFFEDNPPFTGLENIFETLYNNGARRDRKLKRDKGKVNK